METVNQYVVGKMSILTVSALNTNAECYFGHLWTLNHLIILSQLINKNSFTWEFPPVKENWELNNNKIANICTFLSNINCNFLCMQLMQVLSLAISNCPTGIPWKFLDVFYSFPLFFLSSVYFFQSHCRLLSVCSSHGQSQHSKGHMGPWSCRCSCTPHRLQHQSRQWRQAGEQIPEVTC